MDADRGPLIDVHGHAGRCFLAGLQDAHPMVAALGAASVTDAVRAAAAAGVTALTLVHYRVNEIGDVQTEPPVHGGLSRFDLDGNFRPVLTSYHQFAELAGLLRDRGLAAGHAGRSSAATPRTCCGASWGY